MRVFTNPFLKLMRGTPSAIHDDEPKKPAGQPSRSGDAMETQGLVLRRLRHDEHATQGELRYNGELLCLTLENRPPIDAGVKEPGKSRIPAGTYILRPRNEGGFFNEYRRKWGWHGPMVEIVLPGWSFVLFHVGNYHVDTAGCILVGNAFGDVPNKGLTVWNSKDTYARIYPRLRAFADNHDMLTIIDE